MHPAHPALVGAAIAVGGLALMGGTPAAAACSVFDRHPCAPTVCSVFRSRPCTPEWDAPIGQDLRLTIETAGDAAPAAGDGGLDEGAPHDHKLDTLRELFAALRACWVPPPIENARPGMQMSVRLSFKRTGELMGEPRITYSSPDASPEVKQTYRQAITDALGRCTPLPLSNGLGGAVAGRPIAIRFIDNRNAQT
jgi:hypothetical protein